ncbi:MAG: D-amino-acid transaminase [Rhodospirillales bacterium]|nr:D-amino-acid transaminase [Rhodospirillales bacterium]
MSRIAYINGRYVPHRDPAVQIEDRGLQFADSVYEVILVADGHFVDEDPHLERLDRSMREIRMTPDFARPSLKRIMREVIRRNRIDYGMIYIQVTRGTAPRSAGFPAKARTTLILMARPMARPDSEKLARGVGVITVPDIRWKRRDVKSTSLLPNVLAKQQGIDAGAFDSWMVDEAGFITESSASNAWIVTKDKELMTRPASSDILRGITRMTAIGLAKKLGITFVERPFTAAEAKAAKEAFQTSATICVLPVTKIDGKAIGNGRVGELTQALIDSYSAYAAPVAIAGARRRQSVTA